MKKALRPWNQEQLDAVQAGLKVWKTAEEIATSMGRTVSSVSNIIRIYRLRPSSPPVVFKDGRKSDYQPQVVPAASLAIAPDAPREGNRRVTLAWSEVDLTNVRRLIVEGASYVEIARQLGRTVDSVKGAILSRGLTRNAIVEAETGRPARLKSQPHHEDVNQAILTAHQADEPARSIAARLGVSASYVSKQARLAGLAPRRKGPKTPWTPEKIAKLIELKSTNPPTSSAACAEILEVSRDAVDVRASRMGLRVMGRPTVATTHKTCRRCLTEKHLSDFPLTGRKNPGHTCRACGNDVVQVRLYGAIRPLDAACHLCGTTEHIHLDHDHSTGTARGLLCRAHNTGVGLAGDSAERLRTLAVYCETSRTGKIMPTTPISTQGAGTVSLLERHHHSKYGLTVADVKGLLDQQGGACKGCQQLFGEGCTHHVDHCHRTGEIRGLLCHNCNSALGQFDDNVEMLRLAADYLDHPPGVKVDVPPPDRTPIEDLCSRFGMESVDLPNGLMGARRDQTLVVVIDGSQHNRRLLLARDGISTRESTSWLARWQDEQLVADPELEVLLITCDQLVTHLDSLLTSRFTAVEKRNARDLEVREVPLEDAREFIDRHHLQGGCKAPINFGLYTEDGLLVSVMAFNDPRVAVRRATQASFHGWYLQRFCSHGRVRGAASKLLAAFQARYPSRILTHSDPAYSDGGLYKTLGFTQVTESKPDYVYWRGGAFVHKANLQKKNLIKELSKAGQSASHDATEQTLAQLAGYDRIDLPGKIRWELDAPSTP